MVRRASVLLVAAALFAGCGSDAPEARAPRATATPSPEPTTAAPTVRRAHCPPDSANCAAVTGRVVYVEAVDPDGDGDAHYVLAGGRVTAPGISAIDVSRDLRPRRLPELGDLVSAAGPVYTGSHGQRQIQAVKVHQQQR